jgi:crotonobetainyl-CoA:carnitine CoA-transferase CaiB-like acyl-CoA transferase
VPYQAFKAKDDYITVAAANEKLWLRLCKVVNRPDLAENPRYGSNALRVQHRKELVLILAEEFKQKTRDEWMESLVAEGIPCGPINSMESLFNDPQVLHRRMVEVVDHPTIGKLKLVGIPVKYSEATPRIRRPPPLLGEHTEEILRETLGFSDAEIGRLRDQQIV